MEDEPGSYCSVAGLTVKTAPGDGWPERSCFSESGGGGPPDSALPSMFDFKHQPVQAKRTRVWVKFCG